jgi:hypothetical protein
MWVIIGAVIAFLLRFQTLKKLSVDLRRIGLSLGVEGFDEKPVGFHVGGDVGGDVAGRAIDKRQRHLDQSTNIQNALRAGRATIIKSSNSIRIKSSNPAFQKKLADIQKKGGDWTRVWINACLKEPSIREGIGTRMSELKHNRWTIKSVVFDNDTDGLSTNFEIEKPFDLEEGL